MLAVTAARFDADRPGVRPRGRRAPGSRTRGGLGTGPGAGGGAQPPRPLDPARRRHHARTGCRWSWAATRPAWTRPATRSSCTRCSATRTPEEATRPSIPGARLLSELHDGTLAEWVCVPARNLVAKPAELTFEQAACLPTAWLTAYRMLFTKARVRPGDRVLVQGAGGGVAVAATVLAVARRLPRDRHQPLARATRNGREPLVRKRFWPPVRGWRNAPTSSSRPWARRPGGTP